MLRTNPSIGILRAKRAGLDLQISYYVWLTLIFRVPFPFSEQHGGTDEGFVFT